MNEATERSYSRTRDSVFLVLAPIFGVMVIVAAIFMSHENTDKVIETSYSIGAALIVAIPAIALFLVANIQLRKNRESQRAAFLGEYVSKIFTDRELSDTFHYLVYTYGDNRFCKVKMKLKDDGITKASGHEAMYECLDSLQDGRKEGFRFYHPDIFQGSVEEKRLDSLLGYFNIIAYYHVKEKFLFKNDVNGHVGYHLAVMAARNVINEYMTIIEEDWEKGGYAKEFGMQQPFHYLKILLEELALERGVRHNGR